MSCVLIAQVNPLTFHYFSHDEVKQTHFTCAQEDPYGRIWFGTKGEGLVIYDGYSFLPFDPPTSTSYDPLPSNHINGIYKDGSQRMWIATNNGASVVNTSNYEIFHLDKSIFDTSFNKNTYLVNTITEGKDQTFWLGCYNGLIHIDSSFQLINRFTFRTSPPHANYDANNIFSLVSDNAENGIIWVATEYGLRKFNSEQSGGVLIPNPPKWHNYYPEVEQYEMWDMVQNTDGSIWLAAMYSGGILNYFPNKDSWNSFRYAKSDIHNPNYRNAINTLVIDNDTTIYFGGAYGFGHLDLEEYNLVYQPNFDIQRTGAIREMYIDKAGFLWLMCENGLVKSQQNVEKGLGSQHLLSYLNGNYWTNNNETVSLSPKEDLSIELALVNASQPNQSIYQYKVCGQSWKNLGKSRLINLSGLSFGNHQLHFRAKESGQEWVYAKSQNFKISYPFYLKTNFIILLILSLVGFFFILYRVIKYVVLREQKIKHSYEKKILEAEMKSLRSQMNPHFIFNSLNSIYNFILQNKTNQAADYLSKFSKLIRMVLQNSKYPSISLMEEIEMLKLYIELEKIRINDKFTYDIHIDDIPKVSSLVIPPMLIQPHIENAIWHGIVPSSKAGKLAIQFTSDVDFLYICIEDNGVGREKVKTTHNVLERKSLGTSITKERLQFLEDSGWKGASQSYDDLTDENGNKLGTIAKIKLPLTYKSSNQ